jgi:hypothetical protein
LFFAPSEDSFLGAEKASTLVDLGEENLWVSVVTLDYLESDTMYLFSILLLDSMHSSIEEAQCLVHNRSFTTFPPLLAPRKFTFNHGSCLMYVYFKTFNLLRYWVDQAIVFGILLGDSVYLDTFGMITPPQAYSQV